MTETMTYDASTLTAKKERSRRTVSEFVEIWRQLPDVRRYFDSMYQALLEVEQEAVALDGIDDYQVLSEQSKAEIERIALHKAADSALRRAGSELSAAEQQGILNHLSGKTLLERINHTGLVDTLLVNAAVKKA